MINFVLVLIKKLSMNQSKQSLINYLLQTTKTATESWVELGNKFGLSAEAARKTWSKYRHSNRIEKQQPMIETNSQEAKVTETREDFQSGEKEVTIQSPVEIKDLEDLKTMIDMEKWEITKYVQNYWNGKYQVKAWLSPKTTQESELIKNLLDNYQSTYVPIKKSEVISNTHWKNDSMLVLNLNDLHFDKLDLNNNTIDQRVQDYLDVLSKLTMKAYYSCNIEEIVFVVGNDMFNTDNIHNTTTNHTPQQVNTNWDVAYEKVFDAMVKSINYLRNFSSKVRVVLVQGNHDRTKSYYLAHALEVYFKPDPCVIFDRTSNLKKVVTYGNSFIGFNHGNNINDKLPLAFATEFSTEWGACKYHDILLSDKHHNNEKVFKSNQTQNEFQGVRVRILPSLSGTDRWHSDNLYRSRQSGIALIYDKQKGKNAEFEDQL